MRAFRTAIARHWAPDGSRFRLSRRQAPRAAWFCRLGSPRGIGFALVILMLVGTLPAAEGFLTPCAAAARSQSFADEFDTRLDHNLNGVEDALDDWLIGRSSFADLRGVAVAASLQQAE